MGGSGLECSSLGKFARRTRSTSFGRGPPGGPPGCPPGGDPPGESPRGDLRNSGLILDSGLILGRFWGESRGIPGVFWVDVGLILASSGIICVSSALPRTTMLEDEVDDEDHDN